MDSIGYKAHCLCLELKSQPWLLLHFLWISWLNLWESILWTMLAEKPTYSLYIVGAASAVTLSFVW